MNTIGRYFRLALCLTGWLFIGGLSAGILPVAAAEPDGQKIIERSKALLERIQNQKNKVTLKLIDRNGMKREIVAWRYWKNYGDPDGFASKTIFYTISPPESKGISFLIWDYGAEGKPDDLWLYLPELRTTRRIFTQDQSSPFMGSDLTFGDMGQRRIDEDKHTTIGEEAYRGVPAYIVESVPKEEESIYSKKVSWISKPDGTIQKIEYYDRNGKLLKRQTIDWQSTVHNGKEVFVWRRSDVVNVQTGHKTIFEVSDLDLDVDLADSDFTVRVIQTGGLRK